MNKVVDFASYTELPIDKIAVFDCYSRFVYEVDNVKYAFKTDIYGTHIIYYAGSFYVKSSGLAHLVISQCSVAGVQSTHGDYAVYDGNKINFTDFIHYLSN
jgi:hypothetical protein